MGWMEVGLDEGFIGQGVAWDGGRSTLWMIKQGSEGGWRIQDGGSTMQTTATHTTTIETTMMETTTSETTTIEHCLGLGRETTTQREREETESACAPV